MVAEAQVAKPEAVQRDSRTPASPKSEQRHVQLKRSLVGQSYDEQVALLSPEAPVQKREGAAPEGKGARPEAHDAGAPDKSAPGAKVAASKQAEVGAGAQAAPAEEAAEIAPPDNLNQKSVQEYFNQRFAAEFQGKGQFEKVISLKLGKYKPKPKPDKGMTPVTSLNEVWAQIAADLQALTGDMRTFASKSVLQTMAPAKGKAEPKEVFITIHTELYRRPVTKAEDKGLAKSMVALDPGLCMGGKESIAPETVEPFKALYAAIPASLKAKDGDYGKCVSGFRPMEQQTRLYENAIAKNMAANPALSRKDAEKVTRQWVAAPGTSAHNTGHAVDLWMGWSMGSTNAKQMGNKKSKLYRQHGEFWEWLKVNAPSFGFLPYSPEPWHWEKWK